MNIGNKAHSLERPSPAGPGRCWFPPKGADPDATHSSTCPSHSTRKGGTCGCMHGIPSASIGTANIRGRFARATACLLVPLVYDGLGVYTVFGVNAILLGVYGRFFGPGVYAILGVYSLFDVEE